MQMLDYYPNIQRYSQEFYMYIGDQQYQLKNYELALRQYETSDKFSLTCESILKQGHCQYKQNMYEKAIILYVKAHSIKPDPAVNCALGKLYLKQKKYDDAKKCYLDSLETDYYQIKPLKGLALCYQGQNKFQKAFQFIKKYQFFSQNIKSYQVLGYISYGLEDWNLSIEYFLKCFLINPNDFRINSQLAQLYEKIKDIKQYDYYMERCTELRKVQ